MLHFFKMATKTLFLSRTISPEIARRASHGTATLQQMPWLSDPVMLQTLLASRVELSLWANYWRFQSLAQQTAVPRSLPDTSNYALPMPVGGSQARAMQSLNSSQSTLAPTASASASCGGAVHASGALVRGLPLATGRAILELNDRISKLEAFWEILEPSKQVDPSFLVLWMPPSPDLPATLHTLVYSFTGGMLW